VLVRAKQHEGLLLILLLSMALLVAVFWSVRYGGPIMEGDATELTLAAEGIMRDGRLVNEESYSNGYGYQALLAFLSETTGLSVSRLQFVGSLWLGVIALVAYLVYREYLAEMRVAALAVILLLLHPDFIFYILRNSHERTTWTFGLLILWLWARSSQTRDLRLRLPMIAAFYLLLSAAIANNAYFSSTIVVTFLIAMLASAVLVRLVPLTSRTAWAGGFEKRMGYVFAIGFILLFVFTAYIYAPAESYYHTLVDIAKNMGEFLSGKESAASSETYGHIPAAWIHPTVYLTLTGFQWAILFSSLAAWLRDGWRLLRHGQSALSRTRLFLWLFYLGFGVQMGLSILSDLSGVLGSNLQVRLFAPLALVATPLAATWLGEIKRVPWAQTVTTRPVTYRAVTLVVCVALGAALLKVTNDPAVGNLWLFHSPGEQIAFDWVDTHLVGRNTWVDTWYHQIQIQQARKGVGWQPANNYRVGPPQEADRDQLSHILLTELTAWQANRTGISLPGVVDRNLVYDNGDARLYHRRPTTPFQK
jgi:hypothetical protein